MNIHWPSLSKLLNRRAIRLLLWVFLLLFLAVIATGIGIHIAGSIETWERWLYRHADYFLAWRLLLYGCITWGWLWMRRRLLERESAPSAGRRLIRLEVAAVIALTLLEASLFMQEPS